MEQTKIEHFRTWLRKRMEVQQMCGTPEGSAIILGIKTKFDEVFPLIEEIKSHKSQYRGLGFDDFARDYTEGFGFDDYDTFDEF